MDENQANASDTCGLERGQWCDCLRIGTILANGASPPDHTNALALHLSVTGWMFDLFPHGVPQDPPWIRLGNGQVLPLRNLRGSRWPLPVQDSPLVLWGILRQHVEEEPSAKLAGLLERQPAWYRALMMARLQIAPHPASEAWQPEDDTPPPSPGCDRQKDDTLVVERPKWLEVVTPPPPPDPEASLLIAQRVLSEQGFPSGPATARYLCARVASNSPLPDDGPWPARHIPVVTFLMRCEVLGTTGRDATGRRLSPAETWGRPDIEPDVGATFSTFTLSPAWSTGPLQQRAAKLAQAHASWWDEQPFGRMPESIELRRENQPPKVSPSRGVDLYVAGTLTTEDLIRQELARCRDQRGSPLTRNEFRSEMKNLADRIRRKERRCWERFQAEKRDVWDRLRAEMRAGAPPLWIEY